jgi:hypothetical protein
MIKNTIDLLSMGEYYGQSKRIDIAKGLYEIPSTWKDAFKLIKRMIHGRKDRS